MELTRHETALLLQSLRHRRKALEYECKQGQADDVNRLISKYRHLAKKGW